MTWDDVQKPPSPRVLRQFAAALLVLGAALAGFAVHPAWRGAGVGMVLLGMVGVIVPRAMRWLFTGAMLVAFPIGFAVSHVLLALLFYGMFLPIGRVLRGRGWDPMVRRRPTDRASCWSAKPATRDLRRYLRQY